MAERTRGKPITGEQVGKIAVLVDAGLKDIAIADILGMNRKSVTNYRLLIDKVKHGEPIAADTRYYSEDAMKEYCRGNGYEYRRAVEQIPGQIEMELPKPEDHAPLGNSSELLYFADAMIRLGYHIKDKLMAREGENG